MTRTDEPETGNFEALALPLLDSLYDFARWLTRDGSEAEDLVQETCVKALRGFDSFESGTNFRAWMFRILRNAFLTSRTGLRRHPTVPLADDDLLPASSVADRRATDPEALLIGRSEERLVREAIEALPHPFREVVLLHDVEGLRYQEVADALSIPVGTVMSRLSRARKAIREDVRARLAARPGTSREGGSR